MTGEPSEVTSVTPEKAVAWLEAQGFDLEQQQIELLHAAYATTRTEATSADVTAMVAALYARTPAVRAIPWQIVTWEDEVYLFNSEALRPVAELPPMPYEYSPPPLSYAQRLEYRAVLGTPRFMDSLLPYRRNWGIPDAVMVRARERYRRRCIRAAMSKTTPLPIDGSAYHQRARRRTRRRNR